jgi:hypothetical protein
LNCCASIVVIPVAVTTSIDNVAAEVLNIIIVLIFVDKVELCNHLVIYNQADQNSYEIEFFLKSNW